MHGTTTSEIKKNEEMDPADTKISDALYLQYHSPLKQKPQCNTHQFCTMKGIFQLPIISNWLQFLDLRDLLVLKNVSHIFRTKTYSRLVVTEIQR